jgi:hypothetical protein
MSTPDQPLLPDYLPGNFIQSHSEDENVDAIVQLDRVCTCCESIKDLIKESLPRAQKEYKNGNYTRGESLGVKLSFERHPTGHEVVLSARKGCHFCSMMWHSVQGHLERRGLEPEAVLQRKFYGIFMDISSSYLGEEMHTILLVDLGFYAQPHPSYEDLRDGISLGFGQSFNAISPLLTLD